jgi:subtilisin family serine protease
MDERLSVCWKILLIGLALAFSAPAYAAAADDPMLSQQWALADPAAIGATEAWTQSTGAGVLVAVLDTGVQLDHPDLAANIWTNHAEVAGNGRDDDANGFVDDVHGANMFDRTGNVGDDNGHGTHNAGIIAALQGNGIGGSGLAPRATILPVKVLDAAMAGNTDVLAAGIRYAVDRGARIINVSLNSDVAMETVKSAVRYAGEHGAIVVAAAGNNGRNLDLLPSFPAALNDPAVLSVTAATAQGALWSLANTGLLSVDIAAPGEHIASTTFGSAYGLRTGTSAAAPYVSAALALLSAARPDLSMSALRTTLLESSKRSDLLSALLGGGRLDVGAAMHRAVGAAWRTAPAAPAATTAAAAPTLRLRTPSTARAGSRVTVRWRASGAPNVTGWRVSLDRKLVATLPADAGAFSRRVKRPGRHKWRVVGISGETKVVAARRGFRVLSRR